MKTGDARYESRLTFSVGGVDASHLRPRTLPRRIPSWYRVRVEGDGGGVRGSSRVCLVTNFGALADLPGRSAGPSTGSEASELPETGVEHRP